MHIILVSLLDKEVVFLINNNTKCIFVFQIIGTIPLMPNQVSSNQAGGGAQGLQVQPITPQLLTNAQGQIIATVIGNQILPVINTQGITLSPLKPGQQVMCPSFNSAQ